MKLATNEEYLHLNCLTTLGATAARALATHQGKLQLEGLKDLSDEAAEALAEHGDVRLSDVAQAAIFEWAKELPLADDDEPPRIFTEVTSDPPGMVINCIGMKLVPIPAGEFLMGSPDDCLFGDAENEELQHRVRTTKTFLLGMHQVTQAQYERITGGNPSFFKGPDLPVEHLTWSEARRFCELLSDLPEERAAGRRYRLPTEAEWEYACRAGTATTFNTGDTLELHDARFATTSQSSPKPTAPVGSYPPNAWGVFDMHGNVWEWTSDWFSADYYRESPVDDTQGPATGTHHTLRGGSASVQAHECRSAIRGEASAVDGPETDTGNRYALYGDFGVRVVCIDSNGHTKAVQPSHQHGRQDPAGPESNQVGSDGQKLDAGLLDSGLEDWRMVCQAQRPGRLESFQRLAERLAACGDHAAAERLYRRALEGCEGLLGAEHPASRHYGRLRADCLASLGRVG